MKMRSGILWLCLFLSVFQVYSLEVVEAGGLNKIVTDKNITELTVKGKIDARDIKFIVEELPNLVNLDLSETEIVAYRGSTPCFGDVLVYSAHELPDYCFFDKEYNSVLLPNTLNYIGEGAFAGCDKLTEIVFPEELDSIGRYAFRSCVGLEEISLNTGIKKIGAGAFSHCTQLKEVDLSALEPLCGFEKRCFADCSSLEIVNVGEKITDIAANMFAGCTMLNKVNLGENSAIKAIGEGAFASTGLTSFDFSNCKNLKAIGRWAFSGVQLTDIILPASVESIGEGAFFYNESLTDVVIPAAVTEIEGYTFNGNTSLATISLPATLVYVGNRAFEDNKGMTHISLDAENVPDLGKDVFAGVEQQNVELKVPNESVLLYESAEQWQEFNIVGDISTIEDFIDTGSAIMVYFEGKILNVIAKREILQIKIYDPNGVCLISSMPQSETIQIDMSTMCGQVYIVHVMLKNGEEKTIKIIRQ